MTVSWPFTLAGFQSLVTIDLYEETVETSVCLCTAKHVENLFRDIIAAGHPSPAKSGMADFKPSDHHSPIERAEDEDDGERSEARESTFSQRNLMKVSGHDGRPMNMNSNSMDICQRQLTDDKNKRYDGQFEGDFEASTCGSEDDRHSLLPNKSASGENVLPTLTGTAATSNFEERVGEINVLSPTNMGRILETRSSDFAGQELSTSLRAWLDNPSRVIDKIENLHIIKQIAEFVELAHSQGVVLRNVRPSSFLLSSMSRISIIESEVSHTSSSSSAESLSRGVAPGAIWMEHLGPNKASQILRDSASTRPMGLESHSESSSSVARSTQRESTSSGDASAESNRQGLQTGKERDFAYHEGGRSNTSSSSDDAEQINKETFPLKELLSMEMMWYKSPEELNSGTPDFPSDMYSLGVLFVELFYSSGCQGEWSRAMSDLRHRLLPPSFLLDFPKEAAFCLLLLHPNPNFRPKAREILHADVFSGIEDKLAEREAVMHLEEKISEAETTLDFLFQMQQKKHVVNQKLVQELHLLNEDIGEVRRWEALLRKYRWTEGLKSKNIKVQERFRPDVGGSKSFRPDVGGSKHTPNQLFANEEFGASECGQDGHSTRRQEVLLAKSAQLIKSFTYFRESYLSMINRGQPSFTGLANDIMRHSTAGNDEIMGIVRFIDSFRSSKAEHGSGDRIGCFFDDFCQFMKYTKFNVRATVQYGDILNTKNMVCSLNFDCDDEYFATAGVSRRIKIFDCNALLEEFNDVHYPVIEMNSRNKLSHVCWNKFRKNLLCSSDLEGVVQLWDVATGRSIMEFKEHSKCAWSVDFSHFDSSRLASGSDDCCVKLWNINQGTSIGTIKTKANICSVLFSPYHSHLLAYGSADSQVYFHDLRYIRIPVSILTGHQKAVSFVRFAGPSNIVSASTDNTLKLWDLTKTGTLVKGCNAGFGSKGDCMRTYTGHTNLKNFVGLSVVEEGYIACGSETNEVFVYHKSLPVSMLSQKFKSTDPISGDEFEDLGDQFVSSVCWRNKSQLLAIANSVGNIQVLEMV